MIERCFTADRINSVLNHPDVLPWIKGNLEGRLDLAAVLSDTSNVLLMGEHGGVLFIPHQSGIYEAHTQVLPEGRGSGTVAMVNEALSWMFCRTEAVEILTRCPDGNLAAKALAKAIKGEFQFSSPRGWVKDGLPVGTDVYAMTLQNWIRTASGLTERGYWFHSRLAQMQTEPPHEQDEQHDRHVGAAAEMILGGQPEKAIRFYNRWAVMSGYENVAVVSLDPLVIDIRSALIRVENEDFEVIECRQH